MSTERVVLLLLLASGCASGQGIPSPIPGLPPIPPGQSIQQPMATLPEETRKVLQDMSRKPAVTVLGNVQVFTASEPEVACGESRGFSPPERNKSDISPIPVDQLGLSDPKIVLDWRDSPISEGTATRVFRAIRSGDLCVDLTEWNFVADGGGVMQIAERINRNVLGSPAVLSILEATSGAAAWKLSWPVNGIDIKLEVIEPRLDLATESVVMRIAEAVTAHHLAVRRPE